MAMRADRFSCNCDIADCIIRIPTQLHMSMGLHLRLHLRYSSCAKTVTPFRLRKPAVKVGFSDYSLYSMCVRTS